MNLKEDSKVWNPQPFQYNEKVANPPLPPSFVVDKIREEIRTAKALLDLKSEIGRLPLSPRTQGLLDLIEDWFSSNPDRTTFVDGGKR